MVPILVAGAAANSVAYALSRWPGFGLMAAACAGFSVMGIAADRVLTGVDCCPHEPDTEPIPVVDVPTCRGCRSPLCVDCFPEWQVTKW